MRTLVVAFILSILFLPTIWAQEKYTLQNDEFYKEKAKEYQTWLKDKNYDRFLSLTGVDTDAGILTFYLGFNKSTDDSARVIWETVKTNFDANHSYRFEEWLYKSMISIVQLNPKFANIQVYSSLANGERGEFYRAIYYIPESKEIKVVERNGNSNNYNSIQLSSAVSKLRSLNPTQMNMNVGTKYKFDLKDVAGTQQKVYETIAQHAKSKFELLVPDFSRDFYIDNSKTSILYFEVRNLRGQVFSEEENHFVAEFINWFVDDPVNWITYEELHFYIKYIPDKSYNSFTLEFDIKGKYGSGFHGINDWEKMSDMEKDFDPKLERYQKQFANEVYQILSASK